MQDLLHLSYNKYHCWEFQDFTDLTPTSTFGDIPRDRDIYPYYKKYGAWTQIKTFNDEETFVKNYGNPLFTVCHHRTTIVVCKNENKVSLKIFLYYRERNKGKHFFKVVKDVKFLTFNYNKCALYTGGIKNYHLKKKSVKSLKRSNGSGNLINNFRRKLSEILSTTSLDTKETLMEKNNIINRVINTFLSAIPGIENYTNLNDDLKLCKYMFDKKGIKLPNNWNVLYGLYPQPTKKQYSKCDYKYIDAFMMVNNLTGDKLRRVLHTVNNCNINNFIGITQIFGKDYILSQSDDLLKKIIESNQVINGSWGNGIHELLSKKEKNNAFEIFKLALNHKIELQTIYDHFRLYRNLKSFEVVKWKSFDKKTFNNEHFDYSERYGFYTKGEFRRIYNPEKITKTQEIILSTTEPIYPVVLLTSKDYNMESKVQSNCVKGYVDRASSLIISLRKGNEDSEERVTIEYQFKKWVDNVYMKRVQSLGRFNSTLSKEWDSTLQILDKKVEEIWGGKNFEYPEVEVKLAHKTIQTTSEFKNEMNIFLGMGEFLDWKEKIVNDIKSVDIQNNDFLLGLEF